MVDPTPLGLGILYNRYQEVSRRGYFTGADTDALSQTCNDLFTQLPPYRRIVAFALCEFFAVLSRGIDQTIAGAAISWPEVDAAILEAVAFVANDGEQLDSIRIADNVNMIRLKWCGD